ncbi:magnesium/cobalt transporter CorA [soil metagenome]
MTLPTSKTSRAGLMPGSVVYTGERKVERVSLSLIQYDANGFIEEADVALEPALAKLNSNKVTWLNVNGLHDTEVVSKLGEVFHLHPLVLEDIVHTEQRPKVEYYDDYIYIVLRMLSLKAAGEADDEQQGEVNNEQLSIVLGENFVLTFQENVGDVFEPVRERIRKAVGRVCKQGADYLAYSLIDVIVDTYFTLLETFEDDIDAIEDELLQDPSPQVLGRVNALKREMLYLRKAVWPLRELMSSLQREETPLIRDSVRTYVRDVYDHSVQVIDTVETLREVLSSLHDFYLSSLSLKMNEVMKVLTIVGTIFLPLSFLAGVYGMNFEYMPELHFRYAYPLFWLFSLVIGGGMLLYFWRKKWL